MNLQETIAISISGILLVICIALLGRVDEKLDKRLTDIENLIYHKAGDPMP